MAPDSKDLYKIVSVSFFLTFPQIVHLATKIIPFLHAVFQLVANIILKVLQYIYSSLQHSVPIPQWDHFYRYESSD